MFRIDLPGWAVEERNAIDGTTQKLPIVFAFPFVAMTPSGPVAALIAYVEVKGELVAKSSPKIVRVYDA